MTRPWGSRRLVIQYLEPGGLDDLDPREAVARLEAAFGVAPITDVCVGWRIPDLLLEPAASYVRDRTEASLWQWFPVMTGNGERPLEEGDLALGPDGTPPPVPGDVHEFRFLCPHRPGALDRAAGRVRESLRAARFDGAFLDRIRWASPSRAPAAALTCFCEACHRVAEGQGLDLAEVKIALETGSETAGGRRLIVAALLGRTPADSLLGRFIAWRKQAMSRAVGTVMEAAAATGTGRIALDVFSPALASSVGQDMAAWRGGAEWIKAMVYMSTWAPAGVPYELAGYARWLAEAGVDEPEREIGALVGFPVPALDLGRSELPMESFRAEAASTRRLAGTGAAAGIEFVELPGVVEVAAETLRDRVRAARECGCGVVVSWDMRQVPIDRIAYAIAP